MSHEDSLSPMTDLPLGRFAGREAFLQVVRDAFAHAARDGWRELVISDATFSDWPLHERAVAQALQDWSHSGRRFTMVAMRYDEVQRSHARFVTWRKTWAHIIDCRVSRQSDALDFPSGIWSPHWCMQRLDLPRSTGVCGREPERLVQWREVIEELLRQSSPGCPATDRKSGG